MEEKMSRKAFLITAIICYIFVYILFKLVIVFMQDLFMNHEVYNKTYNAGEVLNIESIKEGEIDYFSSKSDNYHIKVRNYFNGFELEELENNYESYALYGDNNIVKAVFEMGVYNTQIHNIGNYSEDSYYFEFNHFPLYISDMLRNHFLRKYHISDDIDLVKYIRERKKVQGGFFTSILKMKENYFFNFVELALPPLDNITYLEGDLEGYIIEGEDYKRAFVLKNDKLYCLTFHKLRYFNNDMIQDILKTLVIEDKK